MDWQALNASVDGRLFQGTPFSRSCFPLAAGTDGKFDADECSDVMSTYVERDLRIRTFGAYMNTEWETCQATSYQCLLDYTQPQNSLAFEPPRTCDQGSIPEFYIDAQNASDIVAAFNFSRATKVAIVVKNTGHDYKGRSSGPDSLAIWLSFDPAFVPTGCPSSSAKPGVTLGSGITHDLLYAFADAHNITVPGGTDPTVGAGGGIFFKHSAVSNVFGLAVNRALQVEVVVPTGEILVANECQNSDLFFALRGGGGGTFGVVLSVTELALPQMTFPTKPVSAILYTNPLMSMTEANASAKGLRSLLVNEMNGTFEITLAPSWLSFYTNFLQPTDVPVGLPFAIASRLIPAANFQTAESQAELVDTLLTTFNNGQLPIIFSVAPFLLGNMSGTSLNPIWNNSLWHVSDNFGVLELQHDLSEKQQIYGKLSKGMDPVRNITPGSGAYQNEADVFEPNHEESYWGSNYETLLAIKNKYDPDHLLDCWHCVGWKGPTDPRFRCYMPESRVRI
ncbi:FAD-binding domain-containing protein [Phellopilus nigrolimitatus]|nr:FAD-binding domain-containing protein [Phellopilus nigrolimitatus]